MSNTKELRRISWRRSFNAIGYKPHEVQELIHKARAEHRNRVVAAGRRTGKSTSGGEELYMRHLESIPHLAELTPKGKRHEFWIVGPEYTDAEKEFRVVYNELTKVGATFDRPGTYYDENGGDMHISLFGGKFLIAAKSAKYPKSLVGEALKGVIMAEAAKMKPQIWPKFIRPMLSDYANDPIPSWSLFNSTPEGKNWFYDLYMRGLSDDPLDAQWWSIRMPSWSNNILFPGGRRDPEILEMERDMTEELFKQEVGADFSEFTGRVYKRFNEEDNVGSYPYDPRWPMAVACDFGYTNPNVALFVQWDVWDNVWVVAEYYQRQRTAEEFANEVWMDPKLGPLARAAKLLYPDPEDPGSARTVAEKWQLSIQGGTGGLLKDRIDLIRKWLTPAPFELEDGHPDKIPKLHWDRSCVHSIREMNDYRYADTKDEQGRDPNENPLKKDDHSPEALSRFFGGRYKKTETRSASRQSKARAA